MHIMRTKRESLIHRVSELQRRAFERRIARIKYLEEVFLEHLEEIEIEYPIKLGTARIIEAMRRPGTQDDEDLAEIYSKVICAGEDAIVEKTRAIADVDRSDSCGVELLFETFTDTDRELLLFDHEIGMPMYTHEQITPRGKKSYMVQARYPVVGLGISTATPIKDYQAPLLFFGSETETRDISRTELARRVVGGKERLSILPDDRLMALAREYATEENIPTEVFYLARMHDLHAAMIEG